MTRRPITDDDMIILRLIHAALRRDLARFAAAVDDASPDSECLAGLRRDWTAFSRQLHDHHVAEDQLVWPVLGLRAGEAAGAVLASMTAEHATIDPALADVDLALAAGTDSADDPNLGDLRAALTRVHNLLEAHLTHEETDAIPLVRRYLTSADLDHVAAVQRRRAGLGGAKAFLPWVLDEASPADRDHVLHQLPPPLRWLVRRWQRQYARLRHEPVGA